MQSSIGVHQSKFIASKTTLYIYKYAPDVNNASLYISATAL